MLRLVPVGRAGDGAARHCVGRRDPHRHTACRDRPRRPVRGHTCRRHLSTCRRQLSLPFLVVSLPFIVVPLPFFLHSLHFLVGFAAFPCAFSLPSLVLSPPSSAFKTVRRVSPGRAGSWLVAGPSTLTGCGSRWSQWRVRVSPSGLVHCQRH